MFNKLKKFAVKSNVQVQSTKLIINSFSETSVTILTALLPEEEIEHNIDLNTIKEFVEARYLVLEPEEQKRMADGLEAIGVELQIASTVTIIR